MCVYADFTSQTVKTSYEYQVNMSFVYNSKEKGTKIMKMSSA